MGNYFNTCPKCGSTLDPGERCDCEKVKNVRKEKLLDDNKENSNVQKSFYRKVI